MECCAWSRSEDFLPQSDIGAFLLRYAHPHAPREYPLQIQIYPLVRKYRMKTMDTLPAVPEPLGRLCGLQRITLDETKHLSNHDVEIINLDVKFVGSCHDVSTSSDSLLQKVVVVNCISCKNYSYRFMHDCN